MTTETPEDQVKKTYRFHFTEAVVNSMTEEEYEALERAQDGDVKMYLLRPLLARFMANDDLTPMDHAQAMKLIGKMPLLSIKDVIQEFMDAMKEKAVPKENGER